MSQLADLVIREADVEAVLTRLRSTPVPILKQLSPATGYSLLFDCVQRPKDEEGVLLAKFLAEEVGIPVDHIDMHGQTAMFFAARDGNLECVKYLISRGCSPNVTDSAGQTCLFYAARDGRLLVVQYLVSLEVGLDINQQDRIGQSAIFYAARDGRTELTKWMLANGALANIRDRQKKCAHHYAQKSNHHELTAILRASAQPTKIAPGTSFPGSQPAIVPQPGKSDIPTRQLCMLQWAVPLRNGRIAWLYATPDMISQFEKSNKNIAAWTSKEDLPLPLLRPTDAFRFEWMAIAYDIAYTVSQLDGAWMFNKPVDVKAWNCLDYYHVIKEPRDIGTIKSKLKKCEYRSIATFVRDMELVLANCFQYNPPESRVHAIGKRMEAFSQDLFAEKKIGEWLEDEALLIEWIVAEGNKLGVELDIGPEFDKNQPTSQPLGEASSGGDWKELADIKK